MAYNSEFTGKQVEGVVYSHLQMTEHDAVSGVPTPCRLAVCTIGEGGEFSLADVPQKGGEVTVIFKNTTDGDLSVDIPVGDVYVPLDGAASLTVPAGGCAGLRTVSDGVNVYTDVVSVSSSGGGGGGSLTGEVGDILFYDSEKDTKTIVAFDDWNADKDSYPASRYTPIGVVVIPSSHDVYGTGECAVMSLKYMDCSSPDEGSTSSATMYWGEYNTDTDLTNLNLCNVTGKTNSPTEEVSGTASYAYMPSDIFKVKQCPTDPKAYYNYDSSSYDAAPSPYLTDGGRNPAYYQTESPSSELNCLADFDGVGNSEYLIGLATGQSDWKTASTVTNNSGAGYTPAACCCWRYNTVGTAQGDWYLPAEGEAGYMLVRINALNNTISALIETYGSDVAGAIATGSGYYYWSSSEYSSANARYVSTNSGYVYANGKDNANYVRAFLRVGQLQS